MLHRYFRRENGLLWFVFVPGCTLPPCPCHTHVFLPPGRSPLASFSGTVSCVLFPPPIAESQRELQQQRSSRRRGGGGGDLTGSTCCASGGVLRAVLHVPARAAQRRGETVSIPPFRGRTGSRGPGALCGRFGGQFCFPPQLTGGVVRSCGA